MLTFSELFLSLCIFVNVPMYPENMYIFCHHHSLKFLWEKLAKMSCFFLCKSVNVFVYAENMYVYFLPPSQSQVSLREVLARKRNLTPTHSLNVCQPVGVEKMANNLYNVWLDIALVKTFLLIVSNWLVGSHHYSPSFPPAIVILVVPPFCWHHVMNAPRLLSLLLL